MAAIDGIVARYGLRIKHYGNQPNKTKLVVYKLLLSLLKLTRWITSVIKMDVADMY